MDEGNIDLTIKSGKLVWLVEELRKANAALADAQARLATERANFAAYKAAEAEREANTRKQIERECVRRLKALELNERKSKAWNEYLGAKGLALNAIEAILRKSVTKKDDAKLKPHLDSIKDAWERFDEVQKEIAKESCLSHDYKEGAKE